MGIAVMFPAWIDGGAGFRWLRNWCWLLALKPASSPRRLAAVENCAKIRATRWSFNRRGNARSTLYACARPALQAGRLRVLRAGRLAFRNDRESGAAEANTLKAPQEAHPPLQRLLQRPKGTGAGRARSRFYLRAPFAATPRLAFAVLASGCTAPFKPD